MAMCVSTTLRLSRAAVNVETHTLWDSRGHVGLIRAPGRPCSEAQEVVRQSPDRGAARRRSTRIPVSGRFSWRRYRWPYGPRIGHRLVLRRRAQHVSDTGRVPEAAEGAAASGSYRPARRERADHHVERLRVPLMRGSRRGPVEGTPRPGAQLPVIPALATRRHAAGAVCTAPSPQASIRRHLREGVACGRTPRRHRHWSRRRRAAREAGTRSPAGRPCRTSTMDARCRPAPAVRTPSARRCLRRLTHCPWRRPAAGQTGGNPGSRRRHSRCHAASRASPAGLPPWPATRSAPWPATRSVPWA